MGYRKNSEDGTWSSGCVFGALTEIRAGGCRNAVFGFAGASTGHGQTLQNHWKSTVVV